MKRRTFLQMGAISAASAWLAGCRSANEKLIPYLNPPDEGITPGLAVHYASSCRSCPADCGILVRVSEGRAKKIEGNPSHPVNQGKLCARGQAALQELYHPDRVPRPLKRTGERGKGAFAPISWEEALGLLVGKLQGLQRGGGADRLAMLTPQLSGTLEKVVSSFMQSFGSENRLAFDMLAPDWLQAASRQSFGQASLPWYDLAETRYLLSFDADFIEHHLSPVQYGRAFGRMRQGRDTVRGHFTFVGPRLSLTAASADRWMPAKPGSEGALALGLARQILSESLYDSASLSANGLSAEALLRQLDGYDLPRVAGATGLSQQVIAEVAREFATTSPALAIAGEAVAFQSNGREAVRAVQLLNVLGGSLNKPGGLFPAAGSPEIKEDPYSRLLSLVEKMRGGKVEVLLVQGDPVHAIPPVTGFQEALAKVPFLVSFANIIDDTALEADLILPNHAALESWGDAVPLAGGRDLVVGLRQPVVVPQFDTRQFPDVLMAVAHGLGGKMTTPFPEQSFQELVKGEMKKRVGGSGESFEAAWIELLRQGGLFKTSHAQETVYRWSGGSALPKPEEPRFTGDAQKFPLHLRVYPSPALHDGRGAPLPWLQQLPDPMSTVVWGSWLEINPKTAAGLGIAQGDLVEVASPRGSLRLPAVIYPGIRPDVVAIPLGQGHRGGGRWAAGRGANPLALLSLSEGKGGQQPAWSATMVKVGRVSDNGGLVTAGNEQGSFRSELIEI